jgi:hypothetical protein
MPIWRGAWEQNDDYCRVDHEDHGNVENEGDGDDVDSDVYGYVVNYYVGVII